MNNQIRCHWCNLKNPLYIQYHDCEWGRLNTDDAYLYEMLILESFQAGLSWECILNKRENFRKAYNNFDLEAVASYGDEKKQELYQDHGIIRNKLKINASIKNSQVFQKILAEYGSFYRYLCAFTQGKTVYETNKITNEISDAISRDLKKRGMTFVGSTIVYAYLQAIGIIVSHETDCFLYQKGTEI